MICRAQNKKNPPSLPRTLGPARSDGRAKKEGNPLVCRIQKTSPAPLSDAEAVSGLAHLWSREELAKHFRMSELMVGIRLRARGVSPAGKLAGRGRRMRYGYRFEDASAALAPYSVVHEDVERLCGQDELAEHFKLSRSTVWLKLKEHGIMPAGNRLTRSASAKKPRIRSCYRFEEAAAVLASPEKTVIPPPPANLDEWTPQPSFALQGMANQGNFKHCIFTRLPCDLASTCESIELHDVKDARLAAAEICENYDADGYDKPLARCQNCKHFQTPGCTFDCFRVAHKKFIRESFAPVDQRHDAKKVETI